jgi:predicted nucleic acid-binding protein
MSSQLEQPRRNLIKNSGIWLSAIVAAELRVGATQLGAAKFAATIAAWLAGFEVRPWSVEATYHYAAAWTALEPEIRPGVRGRGKLRNKAKLPAGPKGIGWGGRGPRKG